MADKATKSGGDLFILDELAHFLDQLEGFTPAHDDKVQTLIGLMQGDPVLTNTKC